MPSRIVLVVLCGFVVAGCGLHSGERGRYVSSAGKFNVDLPGTPKEQDQNVPTLAGAITAHTVSGVDGKGVTYGVTYSDYPANLVRPDNTDATLEGACAGMIAQIKAKMLEKREISLGSHPGREVRFEVQPAGTTETGIGLARMYLVGNRFYQILVLGSSARFNDGEAQSFFDSFHLQGDEPATAETSPATAETTPPAPKDQGGTAAPPAGDLAGWGTPEDPDNDCQITIDDTAATIEVPGTIHTLDLRRRQVNAPRIMRPVEGDFVVEVKVTGDDRPADPPAPTSNISFHGAGLLLWADSDNFLRLERATFVRGGQLRTYVLFEHHRQGAPPDEQDAMYAGGPVSLRLERRGSQVIGSLSTDGVNWQPLRPKDFAPFHAQVGVSVVNTTSAPFRVRFEGLKVGKP